MDIRTFIQDQYPSILAGALGGLFTAWLTHKVLNKRGTFSYFVTHNRVGLTVEDAVFGRVSALWNGNEIPNLYLSTLELKNESMNDYEDVVVRSYTSDTRLLSEQTQVVDTPNALEWTDRFKEQLHVEPGSEPSDAQWALFNGQREYIVPVMNRGQSIRLTYLNSANGSAAPTIWLAVLRKGVKLKFQVPQPLVVGVPKPRAAVVGLLGGFVLIIFVLNVTPDPWLVAFVAFAYGLVAQLPGAYMVRVWRKLYDVIGG